MKQTKHQENLNQVKPLEKISSGDSGEIPFGIHKKLIIDFGNYLISDWGWDSDESGDLVDKKDIKDAARSYMKRFMKIKYIPRNEGN